MEPKNSSQPSESARETNECREFSNMQKQCTESKKRLLRVIPELLLLLARYPEAQCDSAVAEEIRIASDKEASGEGSGSDSVGMEEQEHTKVMLSLVVELREAHHDMLTSAWEASACLEPMRSRIEDAKIELENLQREEDMLHRLVSSEQSYEMGHFDALSKECSLDIGMLGSSLYMAEQQGIPIENSLRNDQQKGLSGYDIPNRGRVVEKETGLGLTEKIPIRKIRFFPSDPSLEQNSWKDTDKGHESLVLMLEEELKERQKLSREAEVLRAELEVETAAVVHDRDMLRQVQSKIRDLAGSLNPLRTLIESNTQERSKYLPSRLGRKPKSGPREGQHLGNSGGSPALCQENVASCSSPEREVDVYGGIDEISPLHCTVSTGSCAAQKDELNLGRLPEPLQALTHEAVAYNASHSGQLSIEILSDGRLPVVDTLPSSTAGIESEKNDYSPRGYGTNRGHMAVETTRHRPYPTFLRLHILDTDGDMESGHVASRNRKKHRRQNKTSNARNSEQIAEQKNDATSCQVAASLSFRYLPGLGIVTVSCSQEYSVSAISTEDLCLLLPCDSADASSSPWNFNSLPGVSQFRPDFTQDSGKLFAWANILCGLYSPEFCMKSKETILCSPERYDKGVCKAAECAEELRFEDVLHALKSRIHATRCLRRQVERLRTDKLPIRLKEVGLSKPTQARVKNFIKASPNLLRAELETQSGFPARPGIFWSMDVDHPAGVHLTAVVHIQQDYPEAVSKFWVYNKGSEARNRITDSYLRDVEYEVNVRGNKFPPFAERKEPHQYKVTGKRGRRELNCEEGDVDYGRPDTGWAKALKIQSEKEEKDSGVVSGQHMGLDAMILGKQVVKLLASVDEIVVMMGWNQARSKNSQNEGSVAGQANGRSRPVEPYSSIRSDGQSRYPGQERSHRCGQSYSDGEPSASICQPHNDRLPCNRGEPERIGLCANEGLRKTEVRFRRREQRSGNGRHEEQSRHPGDCGHPERNGLRAQNRSPDRGTAAEDAAYSIITPRPRFRKYPRQNRRRARGPRKAGLMH